MLQISDNTRQEARACMARGFEAMARAIIAFGVGGALVRRDADATKARYSAARLRILSGDDEAAVRAEIQAAIKEALVEQRRAADDAWDAFLEEWRNERSAA